MPSDEDIAYYLRRASAERAQAEKSGNSAAAILHLEMAARYEDRARGLPVPSLMPVRG